MGVTRWWTQGGSVAVSPCVSRADGIFILGGAHGMGSEIELGKPLDKRRKNAPGGAAHKERECPYGWEVLQTRRSRRRHCCTRITSLLPSSPKASGTSSCESAFAVGICRQPLRGRGLETCGLVQVPARCFHAVPLRPGFWQVRGVFGVWSWQCIGATGGGFIY